MPDRVKEKLVELCEDVILSCKSSLCVDCEHNGIDYPNCMGVHFADHLIANGVTVQEWISVKDGLPENDYGKHWKERKHYLVRVNPSGLMYVAHYGFKEYDWWIDEHDCVLSATNFKEVTHWMPLPEPPKGE